MCLETTSRGALESGRLWTTSLNSIRTHGMELFHGDGATSSFSAARWGTQCSSKYNSLASCPTCSLLSNVAVAPTDSQAVVMLDDGRVRTMQREPSDEELLAHMDRERCDGPHSPCRSAVSSAISDVISGSSSSSDCSRSSSGFYFVAMALLGLAIAALSAAPSDDLSSKTTVAVLLLGGSGAACESYMQWRAVWHPSSAST